MMRFGEESQPTKGRRGAQLAGVRDEDHRRHPASSDCRPLLSLPKISTHAVLALEISTRATVFALEISNILSHMNVCATCQFYRPGGGWLLAFLLLRLAATSYAVNCRPERALV